VSEIIIERLELSVIVTVPTIVHPWASVAVKE
jgi:hypothetical protein